MPKSRQIRILLLKDGYSSDKEIISESKRNRVKVLSLRDDVPFNGRFFLEDRSPTRPEWVQYVEEGIEGDLSALNNNSNAAVLLVEAKRRVFAITYGYGRNLLSPDCWVRDFGLKVTLNTVDPKSLRSIDSRSFEEFTVTTRKQSTRESPLHVFGLNVSRDLMRQVMGTPKDKEFATMVAGSDVLIIRSSIPFEELADRCEDLLKKYKDDAYKANFAFIDNLKSVRDPSITKELDEVLLSKLQSRDLDGIHLAPPEPFDPEGTDGFVYQKRKNAESFQELDLEVWLAIHSAPSLETLKTAKIGPRHPGNEYGDMKWSVYSCLVVETNHKQQFFVLSCGDWFEVEKSFVNRVSNRVGKLVPSSFSLPDARLKEREKAYNARIGASEGLVVLDCKCKRVGGSPIEPCDLLGSSGQFIHVKKKTRSATLSHLFEQGIISAECFLSDAPFRKSLRAEVAKADKKLAKKIPEERPNPSEFSVVYGIVTDRANNWPASLPFFSRLHLMNAADHLERLGIKCELVRIHEA